MSHCCEAALITCEDFRLHQRRDGRNYVAEFIKSLGMDCDLITRAGGIQDILRPEIGFAGPFLRDMHVNDALHNSKVICALNHEDCGAYSHFNFKTRDEELERHYKDIRESLNMFKFLFPSKKLIGAFAEMIKFPDVFKAVIVAEIEPMIGG